jgi:hypothetical protein
VVLALQYRLRQQPDPEAARLLTWWCEWWYSHRDASTEVVRQALAEHPQWQDRAMFDLLQDYYVAEGCEYDYGWVAMAQEEFCGVTE